jgi:probable rRNA maturation factor
MDLQLSRTTRAYPAIRPKKKLASAIKTLLQREGRSTDVEVSIVLCDDPFIQKLNCEHRSKDKPTDVLSFPQDDPVVLGDIVISLDTAVRQAAAAGWPPDDEVILLGVHAALHLIGYDDETVEGATEMRDLTALILSDLGIALPAGAEHPYFVEY